jgi:pentapeptide MXKDX repeat protein
MRKSVFAVVAVAALAFAPVSFAAETDTNAGGMGHATAMDHGCTNGKDAMGHACKPDAMKHDTMGHDTTGHGSMGHDTMGHDTATN